MPTCRVRADARHRLLQVFDEVRNLCLGLAARSVNWSALDRVTSNSIWLVLVSKLFRNLFQRSGHIAESLVSRGFKGPETHALNIPRMVPSTLLANAIALVLLFGTTAAAIYLKCCVE